MARDQPRFHLPGKNLLLDWTKSPPKELWRARVGLGFSSFAVVARSASPKPPPPGFKPLGQAQLLDSDECWTPVTIVGKRLYCRSWDGNLMALEIQ